MDILNEIKSRVSMRDVLDYYGIYPCRGNNIYKCFAHDDHSPSANIVKGCDKFHCFSCGWTGDIFDVVQLFDKCDKKQAIKVLNERFQLGLLEALKTKDKKELERLKKESDEKIKQRKLEQEFEHKMFSYTLNHCLHWSRIFAACHPTRGEVKTGDWKLSELYFYSLKQLIFNEWLMDFVLNREHNPSYSFYGDYYTYYDNKYGTDRKKIFEMIKNNQIEEFILSDWIKINYSMMEKV